MFLIAFFIFFFSLGMVLALWSMREYSPREGRKKIEEKKVRLKGEVKLGKAGEILLPRGHKKIANF